MDQLDKESNETHNGKSNCSCYSDLLEFWNNKEFNKFKKNQKLLKLDLTFKEILK